MEVTLSGSSNPDQQFIQAGWQAAAKKASMSTVTSSFTSGAGLGSSISAAVKDAGALAVFGLYDDDATLSLMNSNDFTNANLVLFGPYTQSTGVRYWSNNVYFMSADPMTELVSLLNWAVANTVPLSNTGYMTLSSNLETGSIQGILTNQLLMLGLSPPVTYIEESTSAYNSASFSTLMAQNPTSMFVFGARGTHTTTFFQNLVQNSYVADSSNNFYVMLPFALMYTTSTAYQTLQLAGTTRIPMGNIRYSYPLPAPSDTTFGAGSTFSSAMSSSNTAYTASTLSTTSGYLSFYGWLFIQQILYIGNTYNLGGSLNYAGLKSNVFLQNRYIFNDIVLGNYGGECPNAKAMQLGAACSCNQGGHLITITKITGIAAANLPTSSGVTLATDTQYIYPTTPCYGSNLNVTAKIASLAAGVIVVPSSATSSISTQVLASFSATSDRTTFSRISPLVFTVSSVTATATTTLQTVQTQFATKGLRVLAGPFAAPFQPETMSNFLILDPITIPPPLVRAYAPNVMYLSSSIQQEIYTAASYLGSSSMLAAKPDVHVRVRSENNTFVLNAVYGSLGYFGVKLTSAAGVGATVNMVSEIPTSGYTFVVGLQASEVASLKSFLSANANAYVIMWFDEFTVLYDTFLSEFTLTESAYMSQLLFSTNVPLWTQSGTGSLSQTFVSKVAAAGQTPAGMRAFLAAMVIDQITQTSTNISWAALQQQMTDKALFSVNNVPLGPYYSNCIAMPKTAVDECNSYTGARVLSLWSYKSVASPSTASLFSPGYQPMFYSEVQHATLEPTTQTSTTATPSTSTTTTSTTTTVMPTRLSPCGVLTTTSNPFTTKLHTTTTAPPKSGGGGGSSDAGLYAAIAIVAVLVVAAALIAIQLSCMVLPCCVSNTFETAPCDGDASTAVVFAEVEKWKEVQRAVPEAASECIAEYRSVVRRLVVKYQCYEAGAFGDAFMVVAREPYRAVKFAVGLQKEMDAMRGPSVDAVDSAYASLGLSSGAVRGLRVRVGVHTDVVDIAYDVDTDHYEYRGAGCIAALRTERLAHGGQVLVTGATCESLTEKQLAGVHAVSLGSQQFQEYEEPVSVFEVVALPHREFGSTSRGGALAVDDPVLSLCSDTSAIGAVDPTSFSLSREVLMLAVSAMPLKQRLIVLLGKCEERGLRIPRRGKGSTDERYADSLLNMLAQCMATPAIKRESIMGGTSQDAKWHGESPMSKPAPEVVMNTGGVNDDNSSSEDETNENTH